jgi:hypothetical protein
VSAKYVTKSGAVVECRESFKRWFDDFKKAQEFREETEAQTWAKKWWEGLDWNLRNCLLFMVCGDASERYIGVLWSSIPLQVRDDLMLCGRTIERSFRGAPWR